MSPKITIALASLLAVAQAIKVTTPSKDTEWDLSKSQTIKWDSVSTDPDTVKIVLRDESVFPVKETTIAASIKTSEGSYTFTVPDAAAGSDYKINLESTSSQNTGILAQSEAFSVEASSDDSTTSAASSGASTTTGTATATGASTMTTVLSTTSSATGTASSSSATGSAATKSSSTSSTATGSGASAPTTTGESGASALQVSLGLAGSVAAAFWMLL